MQQKLATLMEKMAAMEGRQKELDDRVSVIETNSIGYENGLEDLEEKQDAREEDPKACP